MLTKPRLVLAFALFASAYPTGAVEPPFEDFRGSWETRVTYSDPRCARWLDRIDRVDIVSLDRASLGMRVATSPETVVLNLNPATGNYQWGEDRGAYSSFVGARLSRRPGHLGLEVTTKEAVFNCTMTLVGARSVAAPVDAGSDGAKQQSGGAPPADEDDLSLTFLIAMLIILLLGSAIVIARRIRSKGQAVTDSNAREKARRLSQCQALAAQIEANMREIQETAKDERYAFNSAELEEAKRKIERWKGFQADLDRSVHTDFDGLIADLGLSDTEAGAFRRNPQAFADEQLDWHRQTLEGARTILTTMQQLETERARLLDERERLGCDALELSIEPPV